MRTVDPRTWPWPHVRGARGGSGRAPARTSVAPPLSARQYDAIVDGLFRGRNVSQAVRSAAREALPRLDGLRASDPRLRHAPLDLDTLARRVLLLPASEEVTSRHHGQLITAATVRAARNATSVEALAAVHLSRQGVFDPAFRVTDAQGARAASTGPVARSPPTSTRPSPPWRSTGRTAPSPTRRSGPPGGALRGRPRALPAGGQPPGQRRRRTGPGRLPAHRAARGVRRTHGPGPGVGRSPGRGAGAVADPGLAARGLSLPRALATRLGHGMYAASGTPCSPPSRTAPAGRSSCWTRSASGSGRLDVQRAGHDRARR
ncbi:hypothetical protein NKH77_28790 [Streptomyces sp. M19]